MRKSGLAAVIIGIAGALALGIGICMTIIFSNIILGIAVGIAGLQICAFIEALPLP